MHDAATINIILIDGISKKKKTLHKTQRELGKKLVNLTGEEISCLGAVIPHLGRFRIL